MKDNEIKITFDKDDIKNFKYIRNTYIENDTITILLKFLNSDHAVNSVDSVIWDLILKAKTIDD